MVVAIIGILATIAIPQFITYRATAIDSQMKSALKNAAVAMESYFAERQSYPTTVTAITAVGFNPTADVTLTINVISPNSFTLTAGAPNGRRRGFPVTGARGQINGRPPTLPLVCGGGNNRGGGSRATAGHLLL